MTNHHVPIISPGDETLSFMVSNPQVCLHFLQDTLAIKHGNGKSTIFQMMFIDFPIKPYINMIWLVVSTPLKNMSSSVGMKFPIYGKS